ncbi:IS982 family transposase [Pedobacter sp. BS3]|uniref:IS982 family transposase n=1 Tax=Pedobacter sp. BS3 TaxID=2567937 RepID=UPI0011EF011D|nr:IS982 family transposase [Pedobacter sp. BS3]TZF80651.1 IS982 family transposase [Pedobacter sp. BS3]
MKEKVAHFTEKQYIKEQLRPSKLFFMHNLSTNFRLFLDITKSVFRSQINTDNNFKFYPRKPKFSDCEILALTLAAESIGIDSESYLFGKLRSDYSADFPQLIHRCNFNRRKKSLGSYLQQLNQYLSSQLNEGENIFIVDSVPVPVCRIVREKSSKICKEKFETAPDKGYSAVNKAWYYGYKLHLVTSVKGVFHSMDLSRASVHDIRYLDDIKCSGLNNCTLVGDKGYLSKTHQIDLFSTAKIELKTPMRSNQNNKEPVEPVFKRVRKRIETLFAQLCDQFMLKRNYAKSVAGLSVRILNKITAITCLQFINKQNNRPLNHLKYALAF